jgi:hypothetical protein
MKFRISVILILLWVTLRAQTPPVTMPDLQRLTDELMPFQDEDMDYSDLYENLMMLMAHPININTASAEQLRFFNLLTEYQVQQLLTYRAQHGPLISLYELQAVSGFDQATFQRIVPFFTTGAGKPEFRLRNLFRKDHGYLIVRYTQTLERKDGFSRDLPEDQRFRGGADAWYFRFRSAETGNYSIGLTAEKDAGEAITWNPRARNYGFDFVSPHMQLMNRGALKNLIIGHYQAQAGQGLVLGSNFGFGKGGETITTIRRSHLGYLPYTSINEAGFLNGLAATISLSKRISASAHFSKTWRDASVISDSSGLSVASSLLYSGLHRNARELERRKQVSEQTTGGILRYSAPGLDAGIIFNTTRFGLPILPTPRAYNQFYLSGNEVTNSGIFLNYTWQNFTFFSEAAQTWRRGLAFVAGLLGSLTPQLDLAMLVRHYQPDFISPYSNALAENSRTQNEQGVYWGWKYRRHPALTFSGYVDMFRFPWLRYGAYAPSHGHEWLLRLAFEPRRNMRLTAQLREESKPRNATPPEGNLHRVVEGVRHNTWLIAEYAVTRQLNLRTRAQFSSYRHHGNTSRGMILMQDVIWRLRRFSCTARYALFDTDDFENRQYVYENDVWLAFTFPAWHDTGIRTYALIEYNLTSSISLWLRWAHTAYAYRRVTGTGPDRIASPTRNDLRFQILWKF